jgi:hypothetical protein
MTQEMLDNIVHTVWLLCIVFIVVPMYLTWRLDPDRYSKL